MSSVLIKAEHISFAYHLDPHSQDEVEWILKDLSFEMRSGELLGIIGPNGGGKSTLLSLLMGEREVVSGKVTFLGEAVGKKKHLKRVAYLAQEDQGAGFFPLTVKDILRFASFKNDHYHKNWSAIIEQLSLTHLVFTLYRELSGGQKQRVLLAKAFLEDPQVLILDEPTKGLDAKGQDQLLNLIQTWASEAQDRCALIVDHNIGHLLAHCDRIMCLNRKAHWHDSKDKFNKDVLNNVYHCEYEHLLIHEQGGHSCS